MTRKFLYLEKPIVNELLLTWVEERGEVMGILGWIFGNRNTKPAEKQPATRKEFKPPRFISPVYFEKAGADESQAVMFANNYANGMPWSTAVELLGREYAICEPDEAARNAVHYGYREKYPQDA